MGCSQGVHRGRKKALRPDRVVELLQKAQAGESKTRLAQAFGISRETVYQYIRGEGELLTPHKMASTSPTRHSLERS